MKTVMEDDDAGYLHRDLLPSGLGDQTARRNDCAGYRIDALYLDWKAVCRDLRVTIHALNTMPDHVHLACTLPTTLAVADLVRKLKGGSAHLINHLPGERHALAWQPGYGALTFSRRDLPSVVTYVQNQQKHHQNGQLFPNMERTFAEHSRLKNT